MALFVDYIKRCDKIGLVERYKKGILLLYFFTFQRHKKGIKGGVTMQRYFNVKEAMQYLGIRSYTTMGKIMKTDLPVISISTGLKRIDKNDLDNWLSQHKR